MSNHSPDHDQLKRILQLALLSPYEGERSKAVSRLLQRLADNELTLMDIDGSFQGEDQENQLRQRANLPHKFLVSLKSHEEALLYKGIIEQLAVESVINLESHRVHCLASTRVKEMAIEIFECHTQSLQVRLAEAQKEAMREYNARRRELFLGAVMAELSKIEMPVT